ncbi:MAG: serine/threonine protein phosphatase, partial [Bacteroidota bacterium]
GHTGEPYKEEMDLNGITKSIKVKELEFNESGILEEGAMIILEKAGEEMSIKVVSQKLTNKLTKYNWKN